DTTIPGTLGMYRFWITQTNINRWVAEEKMSNNPKDVTFIYGTNRIVYNAGAWFHGSPYHSPGYDSPVGNSCDYDMGFPVDDQLLGETQPISFGPAMAAAKRRPRRKSMVIGLAINLEFP